jgi:hypothetical protein
MQRLAPRLAALVGFLLTATARADVRLPHVFSDHGVLQRDMPLPVWGWAAPGEKVTVAIGDNSAHTIADATGKWRVKLAPMSAGGPHTLTVSGKNTIALKDILIGEVWLCSGQSNMQWTLQQTGRAGQDIPKANHPNIRLLTIPNVIAGTPQPDFEENSWVKCTPETARNFSAVAYYFGKDLNEELKVPIGLINSSWGGTAIEPWTNAEGFAATPTLKDINAELARAKSRRQKDLTQRIDKIEQWLKSGPDWVASARKAVANNEELPPLPITEIPPHPLAEGSPPTCMYNAMIHPLVPYAMRGVIWYQGESNNGQGMSYFEKMKALVGGWRAVWGQGDFPFYYVQVAPFRGYGDGKIEDVWEAQLASLAIPNTGMVVVTDIGNINDIHPGNKWDVGKRLALWAKAKTYGQSNLVHSGPLFKSSTIEGNKIRITFTHVNGGLTTRDKKEPNSFQIGTSAGFVNASAKIDGDTVVVWSDEVQKPEAVRFGWSKVTNPNLMNVEGLPASPFRTDCGSFTFSNPRRFLKSTNVEISGGDYKGKIHYTLDGTPPTSASPVYDGPIKLTSSAKIAARLFAEDGRTSLVARADYTQAEPILANGKALIPGVNFELFDGVWTKLPDFDSLKPVATGNLDTLNLTPGGNRTHFAMRFKGYIDIPKDGDYTFGVASDDGSRLMIDGKEIVVYDGRHPAVEKRGEPLTLKAGKHPFIITYVQMGGQADLSLTYEGPGLPKQRIPETSLLRVE